MSILGTGAAGYMGSVVTEQLCEQRQAVVALHNLDWTPVGRMVHWEDNRP